MGISRDRWCCDSKGKGPNAKGSGKSARVVVGEVGVSNGEESSMILLEGMGTPQRAPEELRLR